jgi:hypothetical protein
VTLRYFFQRSAVALEVPISPGESADFQTFQLTKNTLPQAAAKRQENLQKKFTVFLTGGG